MLTVCHERCTPSADDNGCARDEYTCNLSLHLCVAGCVSDEACRVDVIDGNRDGIADGHVYLENSTKFCDVETGRCSHPGTPGAQAGDPCQVAEDCEADGQCYDASFDFSAVPFVGGSCAKPGCDVPGLECAGDGVCADVREWTAGAFLGRSCVKPCVQGSEPVGDQLGSAGHGTGCRDDYMCMWTGEPGGTSGMCMPGNYNAVTTNNVGQACNTQAECFSPFGHGRCVLLSQASPIGVCAIMDCAAPGLPGDLCGPNNACIPFGGDVTICAKGCSDASECAPSLGCLTTGTGGGICAPGCINAGECRVGESCDLGTGLCVP